mmetsp:Transcript_53122/g.94790  ORF Transcript_53122/g.94790 Transcript_53122/m.94790 type:complete len:88 (+) Transcript_53122:802-1065(+)
MKHCPIAELETNCNTGYHTRGNTQTHRGRRDRKAHTHTYPPLVPCLLWPHSKASWAGSSSVASWRYQCPDPPLLYSLAEYYFYTSCV